MSNLSTKIKFMQLTMVLVVDFMKDVSCKMIAMEKVHTLKSGT